LVLLLVAQCQTAYGELALEFKGILHDLERHLT
jgi:hypothetical protein